MLSNKPRGITAMTIDDKTRTELEAAVFRRLVEHLRARTDVQNIDLMNLAGFCRNCLSNWIKEEADAKGVAISKDESREAVYGMPYETWKSKLSGQRQSRAARGDEEGPERALSATLLRHHLQERAVDAGSTRCAPMQARASGDSAVAKLLRKLAGSLALRSAMPTSETFLLWARCG